MHANVSPQLVANATVVTVYQTNPHIDADVQARHCAELVLQTVRGRIRPTSALAMPPSLVNILCQGTEDAPMRELQLAQAAAQPAWRALSQRGGGLSVRRCA
jgi:microcystin degradation protein MlrC